jgi:rhodanese-related sulfurtransferase
MKRLDAKTLTIAMILLLGIAAMAGCGGSSAQPAAAPAAQFAATADTLTLPQTIDAATLDSIRSRSDVFIVDVREDWEYAGGHVPGATLIPLGQLSSRLSEIPKDKTVVAVCRSGNRSGQATQLLRQQGFNAHNMEGGMISWEQAGLDLER